MTEHTAAKSGRQPQSRLPSAGLDVLKVAAGELGNTEYPTNSNRTKYGAWYGLDGNPWCMMFVQWCFAQAGLPLPYRTASCAAMLSWYRKHQPERVVSLPEPRDIIIYNFGHTGIVESVAAGTITAIEGNTSAGESGSQSNGGMVCRKTRPYSQIVGAVRPNYQKEDKHMDNTPSPAHKEGVEWAKKNGILTGDAAGDLKLTEPVTRQQLCTMLYRFAKKIGKI